MDITIRPLKTIDEYHICEELQRRVWAMPDDLEVVPLHILMPVQRHGGLLLGAFDGDELVGFVFGYLGRTGEGRPMHCSHMMGVAPGYQSAGVGFQLKLAQREFALTQGHDLMTWTYDPLESRNAYLNLHKLGTVCRTYIVDFYGPMMDGLNAGLPSDRFEVEWWIAGYPADLSGFPKPGRSVVPPIQVNITSRTSGGLLKPGTLFLDCEARTLHVEIPANYQAIKAADAELALEWRLATRQVFEAYFAAGYVAVDFVSHVVDGERRSFYVLAAPDSRVATGGSRAGAE